MIFERSLTTIIVCWKLWSHH